MKKVMYSIAIATAIILTSCGGETTTESHERHGHSEVAADIYACPMKCEGDKTYDKKGSCPVCSMDLEKAK